MTQTTNEKVRQQILAILTETPSLTGEQIADKIGKPVKQIRPRLTEMKKAGQIAKGGQVKRDGAKRPSALWTVVA